MPNYLIIIIVDLPYFNLYGLPLLPLPAPTTSIPPTFNT
jgi:hypothetical protein